MFRLTPTEVLIRLNAPLKHHSCSASIAADLLICMMQVQVYIYIYIYIYMYIYTCVQLT